MGGNFLAFRSDNDGIGEGRRCACVMEIMSDDRRRRRKEEEEEEGRGGGGGGEEEEDIEGEEEARCHKQVT